MGDVQRAATLYREASADPVAALSQLHRSVTDPDDLVRLVAAIHLAFHHPTELPESATRDLLSTLLLVSRGSEWSALASEYEAACDGEECWDLGQHIALALSHLPAGSAEFAIPELVALWQRDKQFYEAVLAAVALAFPEGGRPSATSLRESQCEVLRALVSDDAVWTFCGDTAPLLKARGLPDSRRKLQAFMTNASE